MRGLKNIIRRYVAILVIITILPFQEIIVSAQYNVNGSSVSDNMPEMIEQEYVLSQDWTLERDEYIYSMRITAGTLNLNGHTLTVIEDVVQSGGCVIPNGGILRVYGSYSIEGETAESTSEGILQMTQEKDSVSVSGNFTMDSSISHSGKLTDGTLTVYGDFTQKSTHSKNNFVSTDNHTVVLCGEESQTINFETSAVAQSRIANLVFMEKEESENFVLEGAPVVTGFICDNAPETEKVGTLGIAGKTTFENGRYQGDICVRQEKTFEQPLSISGNMISEKVSVTIQNDISVSGNFEAGGRVRLNYAKLSVYGDFVMNYYANSYGLYMDTEEEILTVSGNFICDTAGNTEQYLTNGTIYVYGDFTAKRGFRAGEKNKVVLCGDHKQIVDMAQGMKFATLELQNKSTDGVCAKTRFLCEDLITNNCNLTYLNDTGDIGWTLTEDTTIDTNFVLLGGVLDLNGHKLSVGGDLIQKGGIVNLSGGFLSINGSYRMETEDEDYSVGVLQMQNPKDRVLVSEDFITRSDADHEGMLTDGELEVKGDFFVYNEKSESNFYATDNHEVILSGEDSQVITFQKSAIKGNGFADLTLKNTSEQGVKFTKTSSVRGTVAGGDCCKTSGNLGIGENVTFVNRKDGTDRYKGNLVLLEKYTVTNPMIVEGDFVCGNKSLTVNSNLTVSGNMTAIGRVVINETALNIGKDLKINYSVSYGDGGLVMQHEKDYVFVGGDLVHNQKGSTEYLTNGVLEVKGDLELKRGFEAKDNHRLLLSGDSLQTITAYSSQKIATLELANKSEEGVVSKSALDVTNIITNGCRFRYEGVEGISGYQLQSDTVVTGDMTLLDGIMDLNGHTLTVTGNLTQIGGVLDVGKGTLHVKGDYYLQYRQEDGTSARGTGSLLMEDSAGRVYIDNDVVVNTAAETKNTLLAGEMVVGGDFKSHSYFGFDTEGTHCLVFDGKKLQTIKVAGTSDIKNIVFRNTSEEGICLESEVTVTGTLTDKAAHMTGDGYICVKKISSLTDGYYGGNLKITSSNVLEKDLEVGNVLNLEANLDLNGYCMYVQNMKIGATCNINKGQLSVAGNMEVDSRGRLVMNQTEDRVLLVGNLLWNSQNKSEESLSDGEWEIRGDITQGKSAYLRAGNGHTLILGRKKDTNGKNYVQNIIFENAGNVHLGTVVLKKLRETGYTFNANINALANEVIEEVVDEIPPTAVTGVAVTNVGEGEIAISYNSAQDEMGVCGYYIYRDGVKVGITEELYYIDSGLLPSHTYTYEVCAYDYHKNVGEKSKPIQVTTQNDMQSPEPVTGFAIDRVSGSAINLVWNKAVDNGTVVGYDIYRDGEIIAENIRETKYKDNTIIPMKIYQYTIAAKDAAGNCSKQGESLDVAGFMPEVLSMTPSDYSSVGGDTVNLAVRFKDYGNSIGNTVSVAWNRKGSEEIHTITPIPLPQKKYTSGTLGVDCDWDISDIKEDFELELCVTVTDEDGNETSKYVTYYTDKTGALPPKKTEVADEGGNLRVTWAESVSSDCQGYYIYRKNTKNQWEKVSQIYGKNKLSYLDYDVEKGKEYTYCISAYDTYLQEGEQTEEVSGIAGEDVVAPYITDITPENYLISGKQIFEITAADNCCVSQIKIYLQNDSETSKQLATSKFTDARQLTEQIILDTEKYADGGYTLYVQVIDSAGNVSDDFKRYYTIDNTSIQKVQLGECYATDTAIQLNWKDVEEEDFAHFSVEQKSGDVFKEVAKIDDKLSYMKTGLIPGNEYTFRVIAYDKAGNRGVESDEITLVTEEDTTAPGIQSAGPVEGAYGNTMFLEMTAKDNSSLQRAVFSWSSDKENYITLSEIVTESRTIYKKFHYDWDISALPEGTIYVKFEVYDSAGNYKNVVGTYQIDHTVPSAVKGFQAVGGEGCIELSWEKEKDADHYMIYRAQEDGLFRVLKKACYSNKYSDVKVKTGKSYTYYVVAVDKAGNTGDASLQIESMCRPDMEVPRITGVSVSDNSVISKKTILSALAIDNSEMGHIRMEYRIKGSKEHYISADAAEKDERMCYAEFSMEDAEVKEGVAYEFRFVAVDASGNISTYENRTLTFDLTAPESPELTVSSESFYVALQWTKNKENDFSHYEVYRRRYNTQDEELVFTTQTTQYEDRNLETDRLYYYHVEAVDNLGNCSSSKERYSYANTIDNEKPVIVLQDSYDVLYGSEITFDGTLSYDNVRIESYVWDFGDGTYGSGAKVRHIYMKPGQYEMKLTVYDAAGNSEETVRNVNVRKQKGSTTFVVKSDDGKLLSGAYISVKNMKTKWVTDLRTDGSGTATFVDDTGTYMVSVYATGYLPEDTVIDMIAGQTKEEKFILETGSLLLGELHSRRLELHEMIALGVDFNDPGNFHYYSFEIDVCFDKNAIPIRYYVQNPPEKPNHDNGSKGPGRVTIDHGKGPDEPKPDIHIIDVGTEMVPFAKVLTLNGDLSWMKDMYCAELYVANGASGDYPINNAVAKLNVPKGLSLAATNQEQKQQYEFGTLEPGEMKNTSWVLSGDEIGSYAISAEMSGQLMPFGLDMYSVVESKDRIEVTAGKGLHVHIEPENAQYATGAYYVYCTISNESMNPFYNVNFTLSETVVSYEKDEGEGEGNGPYDATIEGDSVIIENDNPQSETGAIGSEITFGGISGSLDDNVEGIHEVPGGITPIVATETVGVLGAELPEETYEFNPNEYAMEIDSVVEPDERNVMKIRGINYNIRNVSGNTLNGYRPNPEEDDKTSSIQIVSNEKIQIPVLYPGQAIKIAYKCRMGFDADPEREYYIVTEMIKKILEGENLGVTLTCSTRESHVSPFNRFIQNPYKEQESPAIENEEYGDPVDMSSGGFTKEIHALAVGGADSLSLDISYHSLLAKRFGENGYGFTNSYEQYIIDYGSWLVLRNGSSKEEKFICKNIAEDSKNYVPVSDGMKGRHIEKTEDGFLLIGKDGSKMTFDSYGFMTGFTGPEGRHVTVSWDKNTQIIKEDISGETLYLSYTKAGLLGKAWDNHDREVYFVYGTKGNLKQFIDANGNVTTFDYDNRHHMTKVTNAAGVAETENTYDLYGRVITQTEPERGKPTVFEYPVSSDDNGVVIVHDHLSNETKVVCDDKGNIISETDGKGQVRKYTYNDNHQLLSVTDADGQKTLYTYDEDGNMLTMKDPEGYTVTQTYDEDGNLIQITSHDGEKSVYTYNDKHQPVTYINPVGALQTTTYDANGLMTSVTQEGMGTTKYVYQAGRLIKTEDARGGITTLTYDAYGNVSSSTDALGNKTTWEYDAVGNLLCKTEPNGKETRYTYDSLYHLISQKEITPDRRVREKTFSYDTAGRLIKETDAIGRETTYTYDGEDNLICTQYPDGTKEICTYDKAGNLSSRLAPNGLLTNYTCDVRGNVIKLEVGEKVWEYDLLWNGKIKKESFPDGGTIRYQYNSSYQVISQTDQLGNITRYEVDPLGNITKQTDPLGNQSTNTYDKAGRLLAATDANGGRTEYTYDSSGNITCMTDAMGNTTYMEYDLLNRMTSLKKKVSGEEITNRFAYDCAGNMTKMTDGKGQVTSYEYNTRGELLCQTNALGKEIGRYDYDQGGRLLLKTDAVGTRTTYRYDVADRITQITQSTNITKEVTTAFTYDEAGNHNGTTDAMKGNAKATYDLHGNKISQTDAMGNTTIYAYDSMDRCTEEINPLGKSQKYVYDKKGQLIKYTDTSGVITTYTYDKAGRMIHEKKGLYDTTYTYDAVGNLLSVKDKTGTIRRSYDKLNRVTQVTDAYGKTIKYGYDELGNRISLTYAGGEIVRYRYDACQNLTGMTDADGKVTYYSYDAAGKLIETKRPDGSREERTYDDAGRLTELKDVSAQKTIQHLCYLYDERGNIIEIIDKVPSELKEKSSSAMTCTYGKDNRLLTWNGEKVVYDTSGNMTYGPVDGAMANLTYDAYHRLVKVEKADGTSTAYTYDAEDVRIGAKHICSNGSVWEETFVTDRETTYSQLLSVTGRGETVTYTYGMGLASVTEENQTSYYHFNHLGSTTAVTDSNGNVTTKAVYGTYGELLSVTGETGADTTRFLYNGQYGVQTEENGLYYMRARYYSQDVRRFVNLDSVRGELTNTQSLNRYIFVEGNPVSATDPLGLSPEKGKPAIDKHTILGILGCLPFVGAAFSAYDAYLYYKEGNYPMMLASIAGTVANLCGTGGAVTQGLAKSGIIGTKTASTIMKALTATAVGAEVGAAGYMFGNSISNAIDEARENGTISSATLKETLFTGAVCAATTALGVGTMSRMAPTMVKDGAKIADIATPTTTSTTGTVGEVLGDGISGSVGKTNYAQSSSNVVNKPKGWKVGDPIDNLTKAGNEPTWSTVRARYWKNEAYFNPDAYSPENLALMNKGKPPHYDEVIDVAKELHHKNGRNIPNANNIKNLQQVWPWEHADIDPFRYYTGPRPKGE